MNALKQEGLIYLIYRKRRCSVRFSMLSGSWIQKLLAFGNGMMLWPT